MTVVVNKRYRNATTTAETHTGSANPPKSFFGIRVAEMGSKLLLGSAVARKLSVTVWVSPAILHHPPCGYPLISARGSLSRLPEGSERSGVLTMRWLRYNFLLRGW